MYCLNSCRDVDSGCTSAEQSPFKSQNNAIKLTNGSDINNDITCVNNSVVKLNGVHTDVTVIQDNQGYVCVLFYAFYIGKSSNSFRNRYQLKCTYKCSLKYAYLEIWNKTSMARITCTYF